MKTLGVAIIGIGNIAIEHVKGYQAFPKDCKIKVLCDMYEDKAKEFAAKNGIVDALILTDYHQILSMDDIDIVSICLPPSVHEKVTCDCLLSGKHVLCEKPMASSLQEARHMISAMEQSGKLLSIVSQNRFYTPIMRVKTLLDRGDFGKVLMSRVISMWYRGLNYYDLWWRGTWDKEGGGCTLNHSVHQIDLMNWLLGSPESVYALIKNLGHENSEVEDTSASIFDYGTSVATLAVSLNDHDEKQGFFIQCKEATISLPWSIHCAAQTENGFPLVDLAGEKRFNALYEAIPPLEYEGHAGQIGNFLHAIQGLEELLVSGLDGYKALEVITGIYKSACQGKPVQFPIGMDDAFYRKETMLSSMPRFYKKTKSVENFQGKISLGTSEVK
ncbi:Gfo/Idh/MocA family oxidoreductase [uncultured Sphaerochaeta sp.]|uniref:Gfo/Idh/MocA family protein n=1 Tax=uncultured Sphaerochaeta sp. TaxID=886478 RepID=UPI002A0A324C|nr:Gfo/Idh/MocA family oxidoreductase [uncultured Sphaerochaeta sp.]